MVGGAVRAEPPRDARHHSGPSTAHVCQSTSPPPDASRLVLPLPCSARRLFCGRFDSADRMCGVWRAGAWSWRALAIGQHLLCCVGVGAEDATHPPTHPPTDRPTHRPTDRPTDPPTHRSTDPPTHSAQPRTVIAHRPPPKQVPYIDIRVPALRPPHPSACERVRVRAPELWAVVALGAGRWVLGAGRWAPGAGRRALGAQRLLLSGCGGKGGAVEAVTRRPTSLGIALRVCVSVCVCGETEWSAIVGVHRDECGLVFDE